MWCFCISVIPWGGRHLTFNMKLASVILGVWCDIRSPEISYIKLGNADCKGGFNLSLSIYYFMHITKRNTIRSSYKLSCFSLSETHDTINRDTKWYCLFRLEGIYWIHLVCPPVRLSVHPFVCRRHGFRSISLAFFGIPVLNSMCMLIVAIDRCLLILAKSLSKWPPGDHIGFFGFRTLTSVWVWISSLKFTKC